MPSILDSSLSFEQGPIRPPSEAQSLLLRFTRNCSWNKCKFCPVYKHRTFSRRKLAEIKADIDIARQMRDELVALSWDMGHGGNMTEAVVNSAFSNPGLDQSYRNLAAWLYYGTGNVFLQDANNMVMKPGVLAQALIYLREKLPEVKRVTTYSRSSTCAQRSAEDLLMIRKAGLDRVHIGLETGDPEVLKFMKKGVSAEKQILGGQKVKAAGMELSEYVMPGLGGKKWWKQHAVNTAKVLNQINPDFIRLRTLRVPDRVELYQDWQDGLFEKQTDDEVVEEIRLFIQNLDGITSYVASDHIMNLIETVQGQMPEDKPDILEVLDHYLELPDRERLLYRICRRMGRCREPRDIDRHNLRPEVEGVLKRMEAGGDPEAILTEMADGMV